MSQRLHLPFESLARSLAGPPLGFLVRLLERLVVAALLIAHLPLWAVAEFSALCGAARLRRHLRLGRNGRPFTVIRAVFTARLMRRLWRTLGGDRASLLWNALVGRMALVGPRPVSPGEARRRGWRTDELPVAARYSVRPGLVCLWSIRQRANIDYGDELGADLEYVALRSPLCDLGILMRSLVTGVLGGRRAPGPLAREIKILGLRIDNWTMDEAIEEILRRARGDEPAEEAPADHPSARSRRERSSAEGADGAAIAPGSGALSGTALLPASGHLPDSAALDARLAAPSRVVFVNAACVNIACRDAAYRTVLAESDLVFADGIGVKLAGRLLRQEVRQNLCGTDLFPRLCEAMAGSGLRLFLLGAQPEVAERCADWARRRFPGLEICGTRHGYFSEAERADVLAQIREARTDLLLVAFGAPRQEKWLAEHLSETGARVGLGVGGLFDYYSGRIPRAPQWVRELCMEWLWRMAQEPGRLWKRYVLGNAEFLARVALARCLGRRRTDFKS